jgi:hypothetical protein
MTRPVPPPCGGPPIPPGGDPTRVCLVCHRCIPAGRGLGIPYLRAMVCNERCSDLVNDLGRIKEGAGRGRWRPPYVVRDLADGARCTACRPVSEWPD